MNIIKDHKGRKPITIEFAPDEQDALLTIVGTMTGPQNWAHLFLDNLWEALKANGANVLPYTGGKVRVDPDSPAVG